MNYPEGVKQIDKPFETFQAWRQTPKSGEFSTKPGSMIDTGDYFAVPDPKDLENPQGPFRAIAEVGGLILARHLMTADLYISVDPDALVIPLGLEHATLSIYELDEDDEESGPVYSFDL